MTSKQFFNKCLGSWESDRLYMYPSNGKVIKLTTCFTWEQVDDTESYIVKWASENMIPRQLICTLKNDFYIERDAGYFTNSKTVSNISSVSPTSLRTLTTYGGVMYDEYIEFITDDTRFRRTIGYKVDTNGNKTGEVNLVGTYVEKRVWLKEDDVRENIGVLLEK